MNNEETLRVHGIMDYDFPDGLKERIIRVMDYIRKEQSPSHTGTAEEILELRNKQVERYSFQVPYDGSNKFYNEEKAKHFTDGWDAAKNQFKEFIESSPSSPLPVNREGWVKDKPDNDHEFLMVTATLIKDRWNYAAWEINEIPGEGYFGLCELDGEEWGPYEDLSADLYFILPSPPTNG